MVDLVHVAVADETMAELRAVTRKLQALEPRVTALSERAYGVVRLLSDEADRALFPDSFGVGRWDVLHSDPDIAAFYGVVGNLARHLVAVIDGYPAGDPDWLQPLRTGIGVTGEAGGEDGARSRIWRWRRAR